VEKNSEEDEENGFDKEKSKNLVRNIKNSLNSIVENSFISNDWSSLRKIVYHV